MDTTTDLVIIEDSIDTAPDNTEEGSNVATAIAGVAAIAAVAVVSYIGFGRFFGKRQEQKEIEFLNDLHEKIAVLEACETPAEK